jgi:hypothetical protein
MTPSEKTLRDVAAILARDRYSPGVTNEALAARVLETAALSQPKAKAPAATAKKKAAGE